MERLVLPEIQDKTLSFLLAIDLRAMACPIVSPNSLIL